MRALAIVLCLLPLIANAVDAGDLPKTWDAGERLKAADLNADFDHIHGSMFGGGHAQVLNQHVMQDAGIQMGKLEAQQMLPTAWAQVALCTTGRCSVGQSEGISSVDFVATGIYSVTLGYTPPMYPALFAMATPQGAVNEHSWCYATAYSGTAPHLLVYCWTGAAGTAANKAFSFAVWDMNNAVY